MLSISQSPMQESQVFSESEEKKLQLFGFPSVNLD